LLTGAVSPRGSLILNVPWEAPSVVIEHGGRIQKIRGVPLA